MAWRETRAVAFSGAVDRALRTSSSCTNVLMISTANRDARGGTKQAYRDVGDVDEADALGSVLFELLVLCDPRTGVILRRLDEPKAGVELDVAGSGRGSDEAAGSRGDGEGGDEAHGVD